MPIQCSQYSAVLCCTALCCGGCICRTLEEVGGSQPCAREAHEEHSQVEAQQQARGLAPRRQER